MKTLGIRREDKNIWEKRTPLVPSDLEDLIKNDNIKVIIQSSSIRAFKDEEYKSIGVHVDENFLEESDIIFGIKEIPIDQIQSSKVYIFFSHTIKGQYYNMPLLKRFLDVKATLIDYERIFDKNGKRLIFFGKHAGIAGAIDTLSILGKRLKILGYETPFLKIKQAYEYKTIKEAESEIKIIGEIIKKEGIDERIIPVIFGITGYGNVSIGVQEILNLLPTKYIKANEIKNVKHDNSNIYVVIFKEEDMVIPKQKCNFDLQDFFKNPQKYESIFFKYLPYLDVIFNAIFWTNSSPVYISKKDLKSLFETGYKSKLKVIGDISCDIKGSVECNIKVTTPDKPAYIYNPLKDSYTDGWEGDGIVIIAIDNLPAEIPYDSSIHFSSSLKPFVKSILAADYTVDFKDLNLPEEIKRAVIVYNGELTEDYKYLNKYLNSEL